MMKKIAREARQLLTQEQYMVVFRCDKGVFVVDKSFFRGRWPIRMPLQSPKKRLWKLIDQVFSGQECNQHVSVPSKGSSLKTTILVCMMPPTWQLDPSSVLARHVDSLPDAKAKKPAHAKLIAHACKIADEEIAKAA